MNKEAEEKNRYATKEKGKTEVFPLWELKDIKKIIDYFVEKEDWTSYLTFMLAMLLSRRIGDTLMMKWDDFYFENRKKKQMVNTIVEQKTGKTTNIPVSDYVFEVIERYCVKAGIDPEKHLHEYIFNCPTKTRWLERENDPVYSENNLESWCDRFGKDFSEKRKKDILGKFRKQNEFLSLGDYLYNKVEYNDVVKWQSDEFRKKLNVAIENAEIEYPVSCHSLRKSMGYWSKMLHPDDPLSLETLMDIYNHSDTTTTLRYIGLSEKRKKMYFEDFGNLIKEVENGNTDVVANNSSVVSLRYEDLRGIIKFAIQSKQETDMEIFDRAMGMIEKMKIKAI